MIGPKNISIKSEVISKDTDKDWHDVGRGIPMVRDTIYSGGFSSTHWGILLLEFSTAIRKGSLYLK